MHRGQWAFALGTLLVLAAWQCGFPDVTFGPPATLDGGVDGTTAPPPPVMLPRDVDPTFDPDAAVQDATTRGDATVLRPEAGTDAAAGCGIVPGSTPCDCDGDHVGNNAKNCTPPEKTDCDDFDSLVHPGQGFVIADWDPSSPHTLVNDWNCDDEVTKQFPYGITCTALGPCTQGFETDLPCGGTGKYNICKPLLSPIGVTIGCAVKESEQRTQGCR